VLTQIYEVCTPREARLISKIGVDHIGILVGNSEFPRELSVETAAKVAAAVLPPSKVSALFLPPTSQQLRNVHANSARRSFSWGLRRNCSPLVMRQR
jgi:phosphoribosylanthranilate isomerase